MTEPLIDVKRAAGRKRRADRTYRAAILTAREAGYSLGKIGTAAGVSLQAVRQLINRNTKEES